MIKENRMRLTFCKGDLVVIFFIVMLAVLIGVLFLMKTGTDKGDFVVVYQEGKRIQECPLEVDTEILIESDYTNKLKIKDGKAAIIDSNCPGMDCVHSGWIDGKGRSLVCLPNRVVVRISGEKDVDKVAY